MTDITPDTLSGPGGSRWKSAATVQNIARRRRSEFVLKAAGLAALGLAFLMLAILIGSLVSTGRHAVTQTHVTLEFPVSDKVDPARIDRANWRGMMQDAMVGALPDLPPAEAKKMAGLLSNAAQFALRDRVVADPALIGTTVSMTVPVSDDYDQLAKDLVNRDLPESSRKLSDAEIAAFDGLAAAGKVSSPLNWGLLFNADSRFPELAGLKGAIIGTFYAVLICFLISFPLGIGAAIYLEEFAPKSRLSDFIEVNVNNLAAVPSIVFGLLGLAVFLNTFGLPRSSPLVGGLVLALMTMPTIVIATRAALKAVPPSIREAALGLGASRQQVVFHHVLPLALPGIMTGTILGLAHALGETAPLLLVGMNAFITEAPGTPLDSATTLPTQIFIWADSPERGFVARTSAAILVLLTFLVAMNGLAIWLRSRFEQRW